MAFSRTIPLSQWGARLGKMRDAVPKAIERGLLAAGQRCVVVLQERTRAKAFDTGNMTRSWRADVEAQTIRLVNTAPYGPAVTGGRRAGSRMPPPQALVAWVRRKLKVTKAAAPGVAWAVARSIAKRGIRAKPEIVDEVELDQVVKAEVSKAVGAI